MHVDVDAGRVDRQVQAVGRLRRAVQHVRVGGTHGVRQHPVAHVAAVDVEVLGVGAAACRRRQARPAGDFDTRRLREDVPLRGAEVLRHQRGHAHLRLPRSQPQHHARLVPDTELDRRVSGGDALDLRDAVRQFGRLGAQELAPRRRLEEEVGDLDARAARGGSGLDGSAVGVDAERAGGGCRARGHADGGHGGDRGQRLAAETERADRFEVGSRGDLAGRVARKRERQLLALDAAAVVGDDDAPDAARLEPDFDATGAGVERVFDQFLDHRGRPLDHLAGSDLADQEVRKRTDRHTGGDGCGRHRKDYRKPSSIGRITGNR